MIHNKLETDLGQERAFVDAIYFCPHHPDKGYPEERKEYKIDCECRKPKPGMLLQAAKDYNIDLSRSYMIGDRESDIQAGQAAGVKQAILVEQNVEYNLLKAVQKILE
jgi:D,D-heptose 1,7-bisphosphate phosphatase